MGGVGELHVRVPLETVHFWMPLDSVERVTLSWYRGTKTSHGLHAAGFRNTGFRTACETLNTFHGGDERDPIVRDVGGEDGIEVVQLLVFCKVLHDRSAVQ